MYYAYLLDGKGNLRFRDVQVPDYFVDGVCMILMTLIGSDSAIGAMWANIVKYRKEKTPMPTNIYLADAEGEQYVVVNPLDRYHIVRIKPGQVVLLHHDFNKLNGQYMLGGTFTEPSPWFEQGFQNFPTIPYKREWVREMWRRAIKGKLISPIMTGSGGVNVWEWSSGYAHKWGELVLAIAKEEQA